MEGDSKTIEKYVDLLPKQADDLLFGSYPQTLVTDKSITAELDWRAGKLPTQSLNRKWENYGYYINGARRRFMWYVDVDYSGNKYRGVYFTSYRPTETNQFSATGKSTQDDNGYLPNVTYWFKYEPIRWNVVEVLQYGIATLVSEKVLDSQQFNHRADNDYAESDIRAWLNETFYDTAFNDIQKSAIILATVDNSIVTANCRPADICNSCEDTQDKVYLLSAQEAFNTYWSSDADRRKTSADYARSQGCWTSPQFGSSHWWLRSPGRDTTKDCQRVDYDGDGSVNYIVYTYIGVVPVVRIKL